MNDAHVTLIQDSWAKVAPIAPTAATLFYDRLFSVAPDVRHLFPEDIAEQKRKLIEMLSIVVDGLDTFDAILPEVQALGQRHAAYGAKPEHYGVVGDCLLWTLAQGLGADFTAETEEAWTTAYEILASTMINAQTNAGHQPSSAPA